MKCVRLGLASFVFVAAATISGASLIAAPIAFDGTDSGAGPANPRPNSNAAAANFDAAAATLGVINTINFESAPLGNFNSLGVAPGVTATLTGQDVGGGILGGPGDATLGYNTTSGGSRYLELLPVINVGIARLTFNFDQAIQAFGTYITGLGTANGNLFVKFNDGSDQSFPVAGAANGGAKFFGFTDAGAKIVQVQLELQNVTGSRDIFSVDDVRFVLVPEPTSLILATSLAVGALALRRRRMQSSGH